MEQEDQPGRVREEGDKGEYDGQLKLTVIWGACANNV